MGISIDKTTNAAAIAALSQVTSQTATSPIDDATTSLSTDSVKVSKPAELLSKLQQLKESNPDKFKAVMKDLSDKVAASAESSGDPKLKALADNLAKAGETGNLSSLQPPSKTAGAGGAHGAHGGHGGHGGHHGPPPDSFMTDAISEVNDALATTSTTTTATASSL